MSSISIVTLDPSNPTTLEFDISIEGAGLRNKSSAEVRFVLHAGKAGSRMFECKNTAESKWSVTIPVVKELDKKVLTYTVEVIVDGYFFKAGSGDVVISTNPKAVAVVAKPKKDAKDSAEHETINEASGGGEVTGQYAPTNDLLAPEYEPPSSHAKAPGTEKDDELIDTKKLSNLGRVLPGEGTADTDIDTYNPRDVAANIVKNALGKVKRPSTKGTLFKRDGDGNVVVEGILTHDQKRAREEKSARVREILKTT